MFSLRSDTQPADSEVIVLSAERIMCCLIGVVGLLVVTSVAGQFSRFFLHHDHVWGLIQLTSLNGEGNIPAWYSSSALLLCALALATVGAIKRARGDRWAWYWIGLSLLFVCLSADEGAGIHELSGRFLRERFAFDGFFRYAWVIPGIALVALIGMTYSRFVWQLPAETSLLFVLAACVFLGGAIGVEMISAKHYSLVGAENFTYSLLVTVEEASEMLGVIIFLYAVLRYLANDCRVVHLRISATDLRLPGTPPGK